MKIARPHFRQVVIHDVPPGEDPGFLAEQLSSAKFPLREIGFEVDVANKRLAEGKFVPCCVSRDRRLFVPIRRHLEAFVGVGFEGPNFIDLTCRRSATPVIHEIAADQTGIYTQSLVQVPEIALGFKTPASASYFNVEEAWKSAWPQLVISSRFPNLIREFLSEGVKPVVFYEPIPSDQYRKDCAPFLKEVDRIVYKMPQLNYNARFDLDRCFIDDSRFLVQILHNRATNVIPLGSIDILRSASIL